jgi:hypothetical protein
VAELTPTTTLAPPSRPPDTPRSGGEPAPAQLAAECVRRAYEILGLLDQVDVELGSTSHVRQLIRTDMLERLARCEPLPARRFLGPRRLAWIRQSSADARPPLTTQAPARLAVEACCVRST